jgi:hypothetical protein
VTLSLPAREVATVARILSNGWRLMWCDRCEGNLEDAAECYQVAIGGTVRIYCPNCHRRNQRERAYEQGARVRHNSASLATLSRGS